MNQPASLIRWLSKSSSVRKADDQGCPLSERLNTPGWYRGTRNLDNRAGLTHHPAPTPRPGAREFSMASSFSSELPTEDSEEPPSFWRIHAGTHRDDSEKGKCGCGRPFRALDTAPMRKEGQTLERSVRLTHPCREYLRQRYFQKLFKSSQRTIGYMYPFFLKVLGQKAHQLDLSVQQENICPGLFLL